MGIVRTVLLVAFVIVCVLLVLLVLIQREDSNGMGGVFGGGQSAAFGSHSASVLTKTTGVLAAMFFVFAFLIALVNKGVDRTGDLGKAAAEIQETAPTVGEGASSGSWLDDVAE
ncbi:MAG: preprotein translocase subunit SecG [Treponema sp.]|nr:preprotein translocase subunit SecG [Treponema sp.]MCR5623368.1 preprotein translocase subunit SecG [Treponema sp.]